MKVGITGHQNLIDSATIEWLTKEVENEIKNMKIEEAYSCLAIGADQLFAKIILAHKISLVVVIPCREYVKTFNSGDIKIYKSFVKQATNKIQLTFDSPSEEAFYEAGKTVVKNSDVVFAFWDNLPAKGLGGTADIVSHAKNLNKQIIHLNPLIKTKNYINHG